MAVRFGHPLHLKTKGDIVEHATPREEIQVLPYHDGIRAKRTPRLRIRRINDAYTAIRSRLKAADNLNQGAFAAAAWSEQARNPAGRKAVRKIIERHHALLAAAGPDLRHILYQYIHATALAGLRPPRLTSAAMPAPDGSSNLPHLMLFFRSFPLPAQCVRFP